jgi:hypothetical protein
MKKSQTNNQPFDFMKIISQFLLIALVLFSVSRCTGRNSVNKDSDITADTVSVPDTGYTGIKKYYSGKYLIKEVTFKNGVREGLMKSFYEGGQLYQTFWYEKGVREDSAKWFYPDGFLFRSSPYKHDTIHGIQKQYYRTGKVKARIGYEKGLRTPLLEEYSANGKLLNDYPDVVVTTLDEYKTSGIYRISLALSDKSPKVKFYKGEFTNGRFDTNLCSIIKTVEGKGSLALKKSGSVTNNSVGIIAEIITPFGNKYLVNKQIDLPYNDLK